MSVWNGDRQKGVMLDIDGCLADFCFGYRTAARIFCKDMRPAGESGVEVFGAKDQTSWDDINRGLSELEQQLVESAVYGTEVVWGNLPPLVSPNTFYRIAQLSQRVPVVFATARPCVAHSATYKWLERNGVPFPHVALATTQRCKGQMARLFNIGWALDDMPKFLSHISRESSSLVYQLLTPASEKNTPFSLVNTVDEFLDIVEGEPELNHYGSIEHLAKSRFRAGEQIRVDEKIDGSRFCFGMERQADGARRLMFFTGGHERFSGFTTQGMFAPAMRHIQERIDRLPDGYTFFSEFLSKPKHNKLAYERVPKGFLVLFDVCDNTGTFLPYGSILSFASQLEIEPVQVLYVGGIPATYDPILALLSEKPMLGGDMIEGVVVKGEQDGQKRSVAKTVSPKFRETHKQGKAFSNDIEGIAKAVCTENRWRKAVERLRDDGKLTGSPKDIGPLIKEIYADLDKECREQIEQAILRIYYKRVMSSAVSGFAEWYKSQPITVEVYENGD